jgi:outer membrane protein assembly factor BamD
MAAPRPCVQLVRRTAKHDPGRRVDTARLFRYFRDDMRLRRSFLLILLPVLLASGCAPRAARLDHLDAAGLFAYAMNLLETRRWQQAADAFERFVLVHPTDARVQEARYRIGETYQGRREWVTAAAEFNRVANEYPAGTWADNARFQVCRSYNMISPRPQLDQEYTRSALEHCQALLTFYPDSEFVPEARQLIAELANRLAHKDYLTAEEYFRRRAFDSAIIYYDIVATDYPATDWAPRALLRMVQAYERLGYDPEAQAARDRLLRQHPESGEAQQIRGAAARTGS